MSPDVDSDEGSIPATFGAYRAAAWSAAGAISIVAALLLVGFSFLPAGAVRDVLENVAAVLLAIGVLQIVQAASLQQRLTEQILREQRAGEGRVLASVNARFDELIAAVALDERLRPSGITSVVRLTPDWTAFLSGSSRIELLPADLTAWLQEEWRAVLELARSRALSVLIHLPNIKGMEASVIAALALAHDRAPERLADDFDDAIRRIKRDWQDGQPAAGSTLEIKTYDQPSAYGLVLGDVVWACVLPPAAGAGTGNNLVALFDRGSDPSFREWASSQPAKLGSQPFDRLPE